MKRREYFEQRGMEMKKYLHIVFGLGLLLTAGTKEAI